MEAVATDFGIKEALEALGVNVSVCAPMNAGKRRNPTHFRPCSVSLLLRTHDPLLLRHRFRQRMDAHYGSIAALQEQKTLSSRRHRQVVINATLRVTFASGGPSGGPRVKPLEPELVEPVLTCDARLYSGIK